MSLLSMCNDVVTVERTDGSRDENVRACVTSEMVFVPNEKLAISLGDAILRQLPSGLVERMIVTDPRFYPSMHSIPAHYQVKYKREGQRPASTAGYHINISGNNARVNISSTDNSLNVVKQEAYDIDALANELPVLRAALAERARTAEEYSAIGAVASAEIEAKAGDPTKVAKALSALGTAGKWVLATAKDIGVEVAAAVIKSHIGA